MSEKNEHIEALNRIADERGLTEKMIVATTKDGMEAIEKLLMLFMKQDYLFIPKTDAE